MNENAAEKSRIQEAPVSIQRLVFFSFFATGSRRGDVSKAADSNPLEWPALVKSRRECREFRRETIIASKTLPVDDRPPRKTSVAPVQLNADIVESRIYRNH